MPGKRKIILMTGIALFLSVTILGLGNNYSSPVLAGQEGKAITAVAGIPQSALVSPAVEVGRDYLPLSGADAYMDDSSEECGVCHETAVKHWQSSEHASNGIGCVACHVLQGSGVHPATPMSVDPSERVCSICHLDYLNDWGKSKHAEAPISCLACHEPHTQKQKTVAANSTACENCHHKEAADVSHSSHAKAGLTCTDCHGATKLSTGHDFKIGADTCLNCHNVNLHSANTLAGLAATPDAASEVVSLTTPGVVVTTAPVESSKQTGVGIVIGFPIWLGMILGIAIGAGGYWLIAGKDPGESHSSHKSSSVQE